jgi:hypothetical protein
MAVEDAGHGAQVLAADGEHPTVVVAALHLDHAQVAAEHLALLPAELLDGTEVDGYGPIVAASRAQ